MGCRVCRARKVKCDGRPNGCRNCERLQLECVDDEGSKSGRRAVPVSLRKIRTYRSCTHCRVSKTKCDGDRPRCSRCNARNLECLYDGGSAPRWARNLSKAPTTASTEDDRNDSFSPSVALEESRSPSLIRSRETDSGLSDPPRSSSTRTTSTTNPPVDFSDDTELSIHSWLVSPDLPTGHKIRAVVDQYFANIHPLRCFAFVHRPSFTRHLEKGFESDDENALLYIICAQGAKFYALNLDSEDQAAKAGLIRAAGNAWAKKAELIVLTNFGKISIQRLMTCVLLYDFHFRLGEYTQALMLSGLAVRMAHALQVNVEYSPDILCADSVEGAPPAVEKESRRRLMWACYILDAWTGSGVDQLTLLREADIKIQLPCNERNFRLRIPCVTETLGVGHVLQFLPPAIVPRRPASNMGIMAYYIRIVTLWKRVVRYVKHLDTSPPPWLPESDFVALDADLRSWGCHLPEFISYSPDTVYARLESDQLGSLVLLHCTFHHNLLDLYRISMPDLFKLRKPFYFPPNQQEFLRSLQADCFHHAREIASILAEAEKHGIRLLADSLLPCFAYDSSRVMLYYIARLLDISRPDAEGIVMDAIAAVESNSKILRTMSALFPLAESLATTTERWLYKIRLSFAQDEEMSDAPDEEQNEEERSPGGLGSPIGSNPGETIAGLGITRSARNEARDTKPDPSTLMSDTESISPTLGRPPGRVLPNSLDEIPSRSGLQHEQPVGLRTPPATTTTTASSSYMRDHAVDLSDLQNYLSWDMYGIMEMSDSGLKAGIEGNGMSMPSWRGTT
ncbi:fungal-specific transcription factor domain-containing protein [Dactylonectria estremocensis]|uniref:Fungal-specific transcription factor domain-containing protein n=1 Tax=Dactylonectria estremocensis TaxID=1079267 RepID=A0A9P9EU00_9HYPO|nr:fungal-specific transcription factor domain-containing protein [Dactylonectria estremocensis]